MITKAEKLQQTKVLKKQLDDITQQLEYVAEKKTFESSLSGKIKAEEEDTFADIMHEVKVLESLTGKEYSVEIKDRAKDTAISCVTPVEPFRIDSVTTRNQRGAVKELVDYCKGYSGWTSRLQMIDWIVKQVRLSR